MKSTSRQHGIFIIQIGKRFQTPVCSHNLVLQANKLRDQKIKARIKKAVYALSTLIFIAYFLWYAYDKDPPPSTAFNEVGCRGKFLGVTRENLMMKNLFHFLTFCLLPSDYDFYRALSTNHEDQLCHHYIG